MKTKLSIALIVIIAMSCGKKAEEYLVTFETPQPIGKLDIREIPKRFVGKYSPLEQSLSVYDSNALAYDSNVFQIRRNLIVETKILDTEQLLDSADQELYKHDTAFSIVEYGGGSTNMVIKGDSVFYHMISKDTLYSSLRGDVLRKFKGHYFLNQKTPSGKWFVRKLSKFKDGLIVGTISSTADIDKLKLISESQSDTVHNFKLTRKQFKEFVNTNGFADEAVFVRAE